MIKSQATVGRIRFPAEYADYLEDKRVRMRTTNKEYPGVKFDVCVWDVCYLRLKEDEDDDTCNG